MNLSYVIIKYAPIPEDSKNRDVHIIYQEILVGNVSTRDSRKCIDILKELTLGNDAETRVMARQKAHKGSKLLDPT